jgi:hypothetical protein
VSRSIKILLGGLVGLLLLTMPDGRQIPVNYLREGNLVFAGADGRWWRAWLNAKLVVITLAAETSLET